MELSEKTLRKIQAAMGVQPSISLDSKRDEFAGKSVKEVIMEIIEILASEV